MGRPRKHRHWADEEKRSICLQTRARGVSVAQVARRYAMNANLIFKCLKDARYVPDDLVSDVRPIKRAGTARRESSTTKPGLPCYDRLGFGMETVTPISRCTSDNLERGPPMRHIQAFSLIALTATIGILPVPAMATEADNLSAVERSCVVYDELEYALSTHSTEEVEAALQVIQGEETFQDRSGFAKLKMSEQSIDYILSMDLDHSMALGLMLLAFASKWHPELYEKRIEFVLSDGEPDEFETLKDIFDEMVSDALRGYRRDCR